MVVDLAAGSGAGPGKVVVDLAPGSGPGPGKVVVDLAPGSGPGPGKVVVDLAPGSGAGPGKVVVDLAAWPPAPARWWWTWPPGPRPRRELRGGPDRPKFPLISRPAGPRINAQGLVKGEGRGQGYRLTWGITEGLLGVCI
jgi:hypothetical protein